MPSPTPTFNPEKNTLLLQIPKPTGAMDRLEKEALDGDFSLKPESHVTIIGFQIGKEIGDILARSNPVEKTEKIKQIQDLIANSDWQYSMTGKVFQISKRMILKDGTVEFRESIIEKIIMPGLGDFFKKLKEIISINFPEPFPHVTLFARTNNKSSELMGIGINSEKDFVSLSPRELTEGKSIRPAITTVLLPTRPQIDTIASVFILKQFAEKVFPGIDKAKIEITPLLPEGQSLQSLLDSGKLPLDMGGGPLDHHNKGNDVTLSGLVSEYLGVDSHPALQKLLAFARRDDVEGKGTVSPDPLDKAFGLSGLLATLNKVHDKNPALVIQTVIPLIEAHFVEEVKRTELMPKEVKEKLASGAAESFEVRQRDKKLSVMIIKSDNMSLPGYLRSQMGGRYDVVVQCTPAGHVNVLTRPTKRVDLRSLVVLIRTEELNQLGNTKNFDIPYLAKVGRIDEVPNWYYDTATNSLQNGGSNPQNVTPTKIEQFSLKKLVEIGLSERLWSPIQ